MPETNNGKNALGGLAKKFIVSILLFSSFITLLGTSYQLYRDYSHDLDVIETSFHHFERSQKKTIENNLWVSDFEQLKVQLQGILDLPGMRHIEISHAGESLISLGRKPVERGVTESYPLKYSFKGQDIDLGVLLVSADLGEVYQRLYDRVFVILATQAIKTFLVSLFIFCLFYLLIGRHLDSLALSAQRLTLENLRTAISLDRKKVGSPPDELDLVVFALNDMRLNLVRDIEERLEAERSLADHEKLLSAIIEGTNDCIFLKDCDGRYILINEATATAIGLPREKIIGKTDREIFPDDSAVVIGGVDTQVMQTKKPVLVEERLVTSIGDSYWLANKSPRFDENGAVIGLIGISRNITDIRQTREELAWELKVNTLLARLANTLIAPDQSIGVIAEKVYDCARELSASEHGYVSEIDRKNGDNVSHTLSAMMGEVCRVTGPDRRIIFPRGEDGRYPKLWGHALNTKEPFFTNTPGEHPAFSALPEGHIQIRRFLSVPVMYSNEVVGQIALANSASDYTEKHVQAIRRLADLYALSVYRYRMEADRLHMEEQLRQSQKMEAVGTLAGGIAHDFNNILGAILGYAEMIRDDCPEGSHTVHDIEQVLKAGLRAKELVKQILAFSRQVETQKIPMQPAAVIREAVKLLRASIPTTIAIEQDIDQEAGIILADPNQIHQIVMNVCTNAYHAMEEKGGILSISLKRKAASENNCSNPAGCIQLSIRDTGTGIAAEIQKQIFDPYFTTKEVGKGTGMGLAMVHGIVQSYGGSVTCESRPGEGTVFHITLPVIEVGGLVDDEMREPDPVGREHILLIDDEQILLEMGKTMLERLGYHVTAKLNSAEALAAFQNDPGAFDLVITDQTMPDITGAEISRLILQIRPDMPIILCTGYSNLISEETARSMGIRGFAMKPLTKKDIASLIREVFAGEP